MSRAAEDARRLRTRYGPWAVVTGASSGIGAETAAQLGAAGLNLVLVARRSHVLEDLAATLRDRHGVDVMAVAVDLADPAGAEEVDRATEGLDVGLLVAAAGYGTSGEFLGADLAQELDMLQVNAAAPLILSHRFGARFARRGRGGVVLLSSVVAYQGVPRSANYAATKAYVQTLAEGLHAELAPRGVDVLSVAPGPVHSGFAGRAGMTMSRALRPAEVVTPALRALGRRVTVAPGALSKVLSWSLATLPRRMRVRVMGRVMRAMTPDEAPALHRQRTRPEGPGSRPIG
jgi:short-subunit dehydrogenase